MDKYPGPIETVVFFWVNIDWDTPISISRYSNLVSCWSQSSSKMAISL